MTLDNQADLALGVAAVVLGAVAVWGRPTRATLPWLVAALVSGWSGAWLLVGLALAPAPWWLETALLIFGVFAGIRALIIPLSARMDVVLDRPLAPGRALLPGLVFGAAGALAWLAAPVLGAQWGEAVALHRAWRAGPPVVDALAVGDVDAPLVRLAGAVCDPGRSVHWETRSSKHHHSYTYVPVVSREAPTLPAPAWAERCVEPVELVQPRSWVGSALRYQARRAGIEVSERAVTVRQWTASGLASAPLTASWWARALLLMGPVAGVAVAWLVQVDRGGRRRR